ncbi:Receptor-interacting serine/threonine-protein kinase 1 [Marasmius crinis-equi]|uniref:Receptor-interacting serine/threonine-protein kinase 1 n=1 Tax=Marasmius crinis-equi TaxID=585013 RepID=A0ABR3F5N2_9AGAR
MNFSRLYSSFRVRSTDDLDSILRMVEDMLSDEQRCKKLLEVKGDDAQKCLDTLQLLANEPNIAPNVRSSMLKMMLHLSKRSGLCPNCLNIKNVKKVGAFPVGGGGFGDVWKGKIGEQLVCLKVVKVYLRSDVAHLVKEYMREAIVWQQLKHPNLLPFVGMYYLDKTQEQLCLVSPWMERGDLLRYLKETPRKQVDHQALVYDVAAGLSYLHERKIAHGDLKSVNILVTPDERACIGDFGLSRVADSHGFRLSTSTSSQVKGTIRWLAPELLEPPCHLSTRSDIYAYACVCYEILTGNAPFHELLDGAVIVAVLVHKKHPTRPKNIAELTDAMWEVMVSCWMHEAGLRPNAEDILLHVGRLKSMKTGVPVGLYPAPDQKSINLMQIRKNVKYPSVDTTVLVRLLQEQTQMAPSPYPSPSISTPSVLSREKGPELLTKPLPSLPPYIPVQPGSSGKPESIKFNNRDVLHNDSWQVDPGPPINSQANASGPLLSSMLASNKDLATSHEQYEDLEKLLRERKAEERQQDVGERQERYKVPQQSHSEEVSLSSSRPHPPLHDPPANPIAGGTSPSPVGEPQAPSLIATASQSPFPSPLMPPPPLSIPIIKGYDPNWLMPIQPAPLGPRGPEIRSQYSVNNRISLVTSPDSDDDNGWEEGYQPSKKALGKRRAVDSDFDDQENLHHQTHQFNGSMYLEENGSQDQFSIDDHTEEDGSGSDKERMPGYGGHHYVQFVYDAVAERTKQRLKAGSISAGLDV